MKKIGFIQLFLQFFILFAYSQNKMELLLPVNDIETKIIAPYISYDGKKIVFIGETTTERYLAECELNIDNTWSRPQKIHIKTDTSLIFTADAPAYNQNADKIYLSLKPGGKNTNSDIYFIEKEGNNWSAPVKLNEQINTGEDETDPFIAPNGKQLYFARRIENDNLKKIECFAILVSELVNGEWSKPKILPEPVNAGCDKCPRLAPDGKTLYFVSVRNEGENGSDIYFAKKITKNAWMSPIPVDTINSEFEESYPSIPQNGHRIYYLSGNNKIKNQSVMLVSSEMKFETRPEATVHFHGIVSDLKTEKPLSATIDIVDPNTSIVQFSVNTNSVTGEYNFFLPRGNKFIIDVYHENYSHYFFFYNTGNIINFKEEQKNINLYSEVDLVLNVYDSEIYEPLESEIKILNTQNNQRLNVPVKKNATGRYFITLPIGNEFKIEAEKKHFEPNSFNLDLRGVVQFSEFERDIELQINKIDYEIQLSDSETGEGVETYIEITNLSTNEKIIKKVKTDNDGKLKIKLRDGTRYEVNVSPKGYAFYNVTVDLMDDQAEHNLKVDLEPLKKATKIELNDINFETNSADLNKNSFEELNRVVKLLEANPNIKIEVSAHTDDIGSSIYNLKLSEKRATTVFKYLTENNIKKEQIISKGYGKSKPAYFPIDTDENRAKNRRVELEVIEIKN